MAEKWLLYHCQSIVFALHFVCLSDPAGKPRGFKRQPEKHAPASQLTPRQLLSSKPSSNFQLSRQHSPPSSILRPPSYLLSLTAYAPTGVSLNLSTYPLSSHSVLSIQQRHAPGIRNIRHGFGYPPHSRQFLSLLRLLCLITFCQRRWSRRSRWWRWW